MIIRPEDIEYHPLSFNEKKVILFSWQGQIYRAINAEYADFYRSLIEKDMLAGICNKGLMIDTEITPLHLEGYELVLAHRKIDFPAYPNEWCPLMLKDAACCIIDLAIELVKNSHTLGDAHPWNVLFDLERYQPVFVDLGSITPLYDSTRNFYEEFCKYCLYPLMLMAAEKELIARLLMCEDRGVLQSDVMSLSGNANFSSGPRLSFLNRMEALLRQNLPESTQKGIKQLFNLFAGTLKRAASTGSGKSGPSPFEQVAVRSHLSFLEKVREEVLSVDLSAYESDRPQEKPEEEIENSSLQPLHELLRALQPESVLDIGSSSGKFAHLAASLGSKAVYWHTDSRKVTRVYREARQKQLKILPLVMDFTKPTTGRGLLNHWAIAAEKRLACDLVLVMEVLHHIVCERRLNFDQIAEGLDLFAKRWAIVEFLPPEDPQVKPMLTSRVFWYQLDNLVNALQKRFKKVSILPSQPKGRTLLFCEK